MSPLKKIANLAENTLESLLLTSVFCQVNVFEDFSHKNISLELLPFQKLKNLFNLKNSSIILNILKKCPH